MNGTELLFGTLAAIASLFVSSCGPASSLPPPIALDETACDHCGMLVSDLNFAAAYRTEDGEGRVFDDVGCMLEELPASGARTWVKDFDSSEWLDAEAAFFVRSPSISTPMGSGIVAFAAIEAARERGDVLRFSDLKGSAR
jgi:copper chaperone NosL